MCLVAFIGCGLRSDDKTKSSRAKKTDYVSLAMKSLEQKDIVGALKNFDKAIKQEPKNLTNYVLLSQVYAKLGQFDRSVEVLSAALTLDPENGELYFLIAQSLSQQEGTKEEAVLAAQHSTEKFIAQQNEPGLRKAITFLRTLKGEETDLPQ